MKQINGNGILGLFITLVVIALIISIFSFVLGYLLPFLLLIGFIVICWKIIKGFIKGIVSDDTEEKGQATAAKEQRAKKINIQKDSIDVEYTILDDDESQTD